MKILRIEEDYENLRSDSTSIFYLIYKNSGTLRAIILYYHDEILSFGSNTQHTAPVSARRSDVIRTVMSIIRRRNRSLPARSVPSNRAVPVGIIPFPDAGNI